MRGLYVPGNTSVKGNVSLSMERPIRSGRGGGGGGLQAEKYDIS